MEIHNFGKIVWNKNKETSAYTSVTGRWVIQKNKNKWVLKDTKTGKSYDSKSLKACQKIAEDVFEGEEKARINKSKQKKETVKKVEKIKVSPIGTFVPVEGKVLK